MKKMSYNIPLDRTSSLVLKRRTKLYSLYLPTMMGKEFEAS